MVLMLELCMHVKRVKVITTVAAWPEALALQRKLLDKYLLQDYDFISFVDTPQEPCMFNLWDSNLRQHASNLAQEHCDRSYMVPDYLHRNRKLQFSNTTEKRANNANLRAADTLQYAWNLEISRSNTPVLILDNDMFPISKFSITEEISPRPVKSVINYSHSRKGNKSVPWLWSGLLFIDPSQIQDKELWSFDCGKVDGVPVDVSGQTHHWYTRNVNSITELKHLPSCQWNLSDTNFKFKISLLNFLETDNRNVDNKFYCELYDEKFLHFRAGSNWRNESADTVKARNEAFIIAMSAAH